MLLNALTTGRPSCRSTHRLSSMPASIGSIGRPAAAGSSCRCPRPPRSRARRRTSRPAGSGSCPGNGHHDQLPAPGGLGDRDRGRAGLRGQVGERLGPARVGDEDLVPERAEAAGEGAADLAGADDADLHVRLPGARSTIRGSARPRTRRRRPPAAGSASGPCPRPAPPAPPDPAPRPARRPPPSAAARAAPGVPRSTTARHPSHRRTERLAPSRGGQVGTARRFRLEQAVSQQALTRKFRRSPVQPPSAAGASLTHVVHSRPGLRGVVRRLRPGRLLAPASRRRFALRDGWTTRISPRGAAARWSRALSTLRPPPPGAIGGDPLHVAAHERVVTHLLAHHRRRVPRRELRQPTRRTHAIRARPSGRARPRRPRRPTLPAPCRGRPARPRGTARSIPDLQAFLLRRAVLLFHLCEQRLGLVHFLPVGLRLRARPPPAR